MKLSDYIVDFFAQRGVRDFFGYQGTNICHLVDSISRNSRVVNHSSCHEQGAAFAACGLAQSSRSCAIAYATSGPGAANLLSGIANAYFDSLPTIFLTGQINTSEYDSNVRIRQHSFQEIDIVRMAAPITKYCRQLHDATRVRYELEKAWYLATTGRPGSVLIDIPMNIQAAEIDPDALESFKPQAEQYASSSELASLLEEGLASASRPVILVGHGVSPHAFEAIYNFAANCHIPIITSLLGRNLLTFDDSLNFGYLGGAYGHREANMIASAKADLLIAIGISLCSRQIGVKTADFAPQAKLLRIDIEDPNYQREIKKNQRYIQLNIDAALEVFKKPMKYNFQKWLTVCAVIRDYYRGFENASVGREPNQMIAHISSWIPVDASIAVDVGQHMMWVGQSFNVKKGQRLLFSGGHGAMGYAIPAAIGAWYHDQKPVYCLVGDGSFQMNSQELEWVSREGLPIKMVVLNNDSLGMVRFQQTSMFAGNYEGTLEGHHYAVPDFVAIAKAYGIDARKVEKAEDLQEQRTWFDGIGPRLLEIKLPNTTAAYPKTNFGDPIYDQQPQIDRKELKHLLEL